MPIKDTLPETMPAWSSEKTPDSSEPASTDYETSASEDCPPTPDSDPIPDGGHGWVVLCGCTVVAFFSIGTAQSWGVLQTALLEEGVSSSTNLLWVGSLSAGLVPALAILYARIMRMIGPHHAGMAGITVMSLSTAVSSVVYRSIGPLFAAYGVVMGLGMGLTFTTVAVAPTQYFLKKRGLANGIVLAGGGLGGAVISYGLRALISSVGMAWAFRAHCLLVACLGLPSAFLIKARVPYQQAGLVDWSFFKSLKFSVMFIAGLCGSFPLFVPPYCLPLFAKSVGLSPNVGAGLAAGFNLASAVGRIASGWLSDRLGVLNVLFSSLTLLGLTLTILWPLASSLAALVVFVILSGIFIGGFFSLMPTAVGHVFGSANMSIAMGMTLTGWTGGYLTGPPIVGYILEASGGSEKGIAPYRPAMFYAGGLAFLSAALIALVRFLVDRSFKAKV